MIFIGGINISDDIKNNRNIEIVKGNVLIPIYIKIISLFLFLMIIDLEFVYLLVIIGGYLKLWGPLTSLNEIIDLTLLSAIILILRILWFMIRRNKLNVDRFNQLTILVMLLFITLMTSSLIYTLDQTNGIDKVEKFIFVSSLILFTPIVMKFIDYEKQFIRKFLIYFFIFGTIVSFTTIISTPILSSIDYVSLGLISGDEVLLSLFYINILKHNKLLSLIYYALIIVNFLALLLSAAIGPIINFFITLLIYNILPQGGKVRRKIFTSIISIILVIIIFVFFKMQNFKYLGWYYRFLQGLEQENDIFGRTFGQRKALEMFMKRPILGYGIRSYWAYITGITGWNNYPHNVILEVISELGIAGLVIFFFFLSMVLCKIKLMLKYYNKENIIMGLISSLWVYFFLSSLVSGDINSNKIFWCISGLIFSYKLGGDIH